MWRPIRPNLQRCLFLPSLHPSLRRPWVSPPKAVHPTDGWNDHPGYRNPLSGIVVIEWWKWDTCGRVLNSKPSSEAFAKMSFQNIAQAILLWRNSSVIVSLLGSTASDLNIHIFAITCGERKLHCCTLFSFEISTGLSWYWHKHCCQRKLTNCCCNLQSFMKEIVLESIHYTLHQLFSPMVFPWLQTLSHERVDFFRVWPWPGRGRVAVAVWPWPVAG